MYFRAFPITQYTLDDGSSYQLIQDIFKRVVMSYATRTKQAYFQIYELKDGETPEVVAHKFYRNTNYHWIILHANEIIDPRFDWCLSQEDLKEYCIAKYNGNIYGIRHWEWVIYEGTEAEQRLESPIEIGEYQTSISYWEYEDRINEAKRSIKVVVPQLVPTLQVEFNKLIKA